MTRLRERPGARVVVIDDSVRVLLFCYVDEATGKPHWVPPGGAIEAGETHEEAAQRELAEEVGLSDVVLRPCNWTRDFVWESDGEAFRCRERWFVARVATAFSVDPPPGEQIADWRWWTLDELENARVEGVDIQPRGLPELVAALLAEGPPRDAIDVSG